MNFLAELGHLVGDRCKRLRKRVFDLLWISDHNTLAITKNDVTWNAYDGGIIGNISQDYRACTNA